MPLRRRTPVRCPYCQSVNTDACGASSVRRRARRFFSATGVTNPSSSSRQSDAHSHSARDRPHSSLRLVPVPEPSARRHPIPPPGGPQPRRRRTDARRRQRRHHESQGAVLLVGRARLRVDGVFARDAREDPKETDTTTAGSGFGAMIERKVKSGVQSLLSTRVMVPWTTSRVSGTKTARSSSRIARARAA